MVSMAVPAFRPPEPTLSQERVEGPPSAPERRLVRGAQQGSAEDFEALFALHWPRAYRTAWLVVHDAAAAEDIARRRSSRRCGRSAVSTGAARSGRG